VAVLPPKPRVESTSLNGKRNGAIKACGFV
jgi:hypothetical protein